MPEQFAVLRTGAFLKTVMDPFQSHIEDHWTSEEVEAIEKDHKVLLRAYKTEPALKKRLEGYSMKTIFNRS